MKFCKFILIILFFSIAAVSSAEPKSFTSEQVKTAYIFNFLQFIEWPGGAAELPSVKVAVVGVVPDNFKENLNKLKEKNIKTRPIEVVYFADSNSALSSSDSISLIYIMQLSESDEVTILKKFSEKPVLTIGDGETFIKNGGMIMFTDKDQRVLFDINLAQAEKNNFRIPSRLQRIANQIHKEG